jgi:pSer/pThr/pTyr-binding forkhead associated (FHA) protein
MTEKKHSENTTRIRPSSLPSEKIPSRYQASVVVLKGHAQGMEYLIDRTSAVIGREKHAQIYLKDPLISREHAVITFQGGAFVLKDLGSTNGTVMNGISIKQVDLRHGDTFRVGDTVLQFVLEDTGQTSTYELT